MNDVQGRCSEPSTTKRFHADPQNPTWLENDRFGLFIHWGLYSVAARHEWLKQRKQLTDAAYRPYFEHFDPDLYDPDLWADAAWNCGMRYMVATAKHHDGFCLWESADTSYHAGNSPAERDVLSPMFAAFADRGFRIGAYYSLLDWHHPHFTVDDLHPQSGVENRASLNEGRSMDRYVDYMHGQVRDLLTRYDLEYLWFDFSYPPGRGGWPDGLDGKGRNDWRSAELLTLIRELAPNILLNNRLDLDDGYDVVTPEQYQPVEWMTFEGAPVRWEACQTFSGSWGYHRDEPDWKSVEQLVVMLIDTVSKGGSLLLNVGPTGRGEFDQRALDRLGGIGQWMRQHERSIRGCTASPYTPPPDARYTQNGDRLYLHLVRYPFRHVHLPGLAGRITYAQFLHDGSQVDLAAPARGAGLGLSTMGSIPDDTATLELPVQQPPCVVPVIEIFLAPDSTTTT